MKPKQLILTALLLALCLVTTMSVQIPIFGGGYIHPGDGFVLISGILLGPVWGFVAAGIGSALADVMLGFSIYAPATLLIKGLMALIVGLWPSRKPGYLLIGLILAELCMVAGYFFFEWLVILKNMPAALGGISWNLIQALGGAAIGFFLYLALSKTNLLKEKTEV